MSRRAWWVICSGALAFAVAYSTFDLRGGEQAIWIPLLVLGVTGIVFAIFTSPADSQSDIQKIAVWAALLFPTYVALQLIPLPSALLNVISSARLELAEALGAVAPARFASLSIAPSTTAAHLSRIVAYTIVFLLVSAAMRKSTNIWTPALPLIGLGGLEAGWGFVQQYVGAKEISGTYWNRDLFAGLLQMVLPFMLMYGVVLLYRSREQYGSAVLASIKSCGVWLVAVAAVLAIVFSFSKMGFVSTLGSLFVMAVIGLAPKLSGWKKWPSLGLVGIFLAFAFVFLPPNELIGQLGTAASDPSLEGRWPIWKDTLHLIAAYPLFGCGLGNYASAFPKYETADLAVSWIWAHNDYLQLLSELGIIGFLIPATLISSVLVYAARTAVSDSSRDKRLLGLACLGGTSAILIHSFVNFNLYAPANAMVLSWISGIAIGLRRPLNRKPNRSNPSPSFVRKFLLALGFLVSVYAGGQLVLIHVFHGNADAESLFCRFGVCDTEGARAVLRQASGGGGIAAFPRANVVNFVRRNPARSDYWCDLGEALQKTGQIEPARHCFLTAVALAPHMPDILFRAGRFFLDKGEDWRALQLMAGAMKADPTYDPAVFADNEQKRVPIEEVLRYGLPDQRASQKYLRFLVSRQRPVDAQKAWDWILAHRYADNKLASEYVEFLISKKQYEAAEQAWARYACDRDKTYPESNRVFNGDFESDPTESRFDWRIEAAPGAAIDFDREVHYSGARSLRIQFDGTQNLSKIGVSQTVFLKPGRYRFEAYVRARDISTDEGVAFRVANEDAPNRLSFTTKPVLGSTEWTLIEHPFTVSPTGAGLVDIGLIRSPSLRFDNLIRGTFWIDPVSISPEKSTE